MPDPSETAQRCVQCYEPWGEGKGGEGTGGKEGKEGKGGEGGGGKVEKGEEIGLIEGESNYTEGVSTEGRVSMGHTDHNSTT